MTKKTYGFRPKDIELIVRYKYIYVLAQKTNEDDWKDKYTLDEERLLSLKTSYGYLISSHKNPSLPKCQIFVDEYSDEDNKDGGTGKSIVMNSIEHFNKISM